MADNKKISITHTATIAAAAVLAAGAILGGAKLLKAEKPITLTTLYQRSLRLLP